MNLARIIGQRFEIREQVLQTNLEDFGEIKQFEICDPDLLRFDFRQQASSAIPSGKLEALS